MNRIKHYLLEKYDIIMHPEDHWTIELGDFIEKYTDIIVARITKKGLKIVVRFTVGITILISLLALWN